MELDEQELVARHGAHTVILYGSRARGDASPESDVDVAGFTEREETFHDARLWRGLYLDAFVLPEGKARAPDAELLRLRGGKVLLDERGLARPLLEAVDALFARGPEPLSVHAKQVRRSWLRKMLARAARGDPEGDYRRAWLLFDALEAYFALRDRWFRGPKEALAELQAGEPEVYALFVEALRPGASHDALTALVERVTR